MYNNKNTPLSTDTPFKANCVKKLNNLPFDYKTLPYSSNKQGLLKLKKIIENLSIIYLSSNLIFSCNCNIVVNSVFLVC